MGIKLTDILRVILKEQEEAPSSVTDTLNRFKVLRLVLTDLLTSGSESDFDKEDDLTKLVSDIEIIVFKPTTFQIKFKNGSMMNLKYDPTPMELDPSKNTKYKARDYFQCQIMGKKFDLGNRSQYLQALNYIGQALTNKPIGSTDKQTTKDQDKLPEETHDDTTDTSDEEK